MREEKDMRQAFRHALEQESEIGAVKIISNWFFEPPHLFDPNSRKRLKPEVVMGSAYIALMAAVCVAFNLL